MSDAIFVINRNWKKESPRTIPLWVFSYCRFYPHAVNCSFLFFMAFMMNFMTVWRFLHFQTFYYPSLQDQIIGLIVVNPYNGYIFLFIYIVGHMFLLFSPDNVSVLFKTLQEIQTNQIYSVICAVRIFFIIINVRSFLLLQMVSLKGSFLIKISLIFIIISDIFVLPIIYSVAEWICRWLTGFLKPEPLYAIIALCFPI